MAKGLDSELQERATKQRRLGEHYARGASFTGASIGERIRRRGRYRAEEAKAFKAARTTQSIRSNEVIAARCNGIVKLLRDAPHPMTARDIAAARRKTLRTVQRLLAKLIKHGRVARMTLREANGETTTYRAVSP